MVSHNFKLERGLLKEETGREHLDLKQYKEITNFDKVKEKLQKMKSLKNYIMKMLICI